MPFLRWDGHSVHVMSLVTKLYKNSEFTDCTLDTNGGLIHGHKTILVACSPYLKKLIIDHYGMQIIPFKEVKYNDMKLILDFVYFGEVDVPDTDMPSLIETAQLLQISSLTCYSLNFFKISSTNSDCDRSIDNSRTMCGVDLTKYDDRGLSVQDPKVLWNQDIHHANNEDRLTADMENINLPSRRGCKTNATNVLKESSPKQNPKISQGSDNIQDGLIPFTFVAVPTFSIKTELIDDEQSNRTEGEGEWEFQTESEVKIENEEKNDVNELDLKVTENASIAKALEMNSTAHEMEHSCEGLTARVDDSIITTTENMCEEESMETETLGKTADCDYSRDFFAEGMEFKSVGDILKCELKEEEPFETGSDEETVDDNNDVLTLNKVSESLKRGAEKMSHINFEKTVYQGLDMPDTNRLQIRETTVDLERVGTLCKMRMGYNHSAFEESCSSSTTQIQPKESKVDRNTEGDVDCSEYVFLSSEIRHNDRDMRTHTSDKFFKCDICEASFSRNSILKNHMRTHTGEKPFKCVNCDASFSENGQLKRHMRTHTGEKPFKCDICEQSFSANVTLKIHIRNHTGEKPFKCVICERSFSGKGNLRNHMRTHTGEKAHKCDICKGLFSTNTTLKNHMRIHTGEKPFTCHICERSFTERSNLRSHMRTHTGEKRFKCDLCERLFATNCTLKNHMQIHTGVKPFKCHLCERSFYEKRNLKTHIRTHQ